MLREFVEIESGKRDDNRPELKEALEARKQTGARWGLSEDAMKQMTIEEFDALPKEKYSQ